MQTTTQQRQQIAELLDVTDDTAGIVIIALPNVVQCLIGTFAVSNRQKNDPYELTKEVVSSELSPHLKISIIHEIISIY